MHIKLHDRDCNEVCQVPGCAARFSTRRLLDNHVKEQHPSDKQYRSSLVGRCYLLRQISLMLQTSRLFLNTRYITETCSTVAFCVNRDWYYLSLSSRAVVDQHMRPQVHARLHGLETPPRVCWPSFQSASRCSPCSLVEDGHVLLFHVLAGIAHSYWHVGSVYFGACVRGNAVVDHVLCV